MTGPPSSRLFHHEAQQQRTSRFASRKNCQNLVSGLDWTTAKKAAKLLPKQQVQHMRTWNQAAIHYRQGDKIKTCPLCKVPATPKHIVWLCTWHHNQGHAPLAIEWTERLQDPLEEPLWAHGWVPKERRITCKWHNHFKDKGAGTPSNPCLSNHGKGFL